MYYGAKQTHVRCGAICLIALIVASSDQEKSASKQLAPQSYMWGDLFNRPGCASSDQEKSASKQLAPGTPYTHLLTDLC
jgi:hypothetical protein